MMINTNIKYKAIEDLPLYGGQSRRRKLIQYLHSKIRQYPEGIRIKKLWGIVALEAGLSASRCNHFIRLLEELGEVKVSDGVVYPIESA